MSVYIASTKAHEVIGVFSTFEKAAEAIEQVLSAGLIPGQSLNRINDDQWLIFPDMRPAGDNEVDGAIGHWTVDSVERVTRYALTARFLAAASGDAETEAT